MAARKSPKTANTTKKQSAEGKTQAGTPVKRRRSRGSRREEISGQLETIFFAEGFRDQTIDRLAKRLSCSNRTLYEVASSKEEMFLVALERCLEQARQEGLRGALAHTDPIRRIEAYLQPGVNYSKRLSAKVNQDIQSYLPAKQMLERYREERMRVLEDIISSGIEAGSFCEVHPHVVAEILLSAIHRFEQLDTEQRAGLSFDQAIAELYELILHGLVRR